MAKKIKRRQFLAGVAAAPPRARRRACGRPGRGRASVPGPNDDRSLFDLPPQTIGKTGSDFMVDVLKSVGIDYIASCPGSTFRAIHESIITYGNNSKPEFLTTLHEDTSAAMCHGYAKIAKKPMACMVHGTVGLQHASMAIYNAFADRVPMLILSGNIGNVDHAPGDRRVEPQRPGSGRDRPRLHQVGRSADLAPGLRQIDGARAWT